MINFRQIHPRASSYHLGYIDQFLSEADPSPAKEQLDKNYKHGGGWNKFTGFTFDPEAMTIKYPGDPAFPALWEGHLREERIIVFQSAWVMILQKDGSHEIARMD